jgi:hypothetical protein
LKQAKVRLTREIKKSADNYRSWKQRQDREVGRLQDAERKGRHQLDKQTKLHSRQQAVLQRKVKEFSFVFIFIVFVKLNTNKQL